MEIKEITVLVHPDHTQRRSGYLYRSPWQEELRRRWDFRVEKLEKNSNGILIYFSDIITEMLQKYFNDSLEPPKLDKEELDRIKRYRQVLGDRFFLFGHNDHPETSDFNCLFRERGMTISVNNVELTMTAMGEWYEGCVNAWGQEVKAALGILDENYYLDRRRSFSLWEDSSTLSRWMKEDARQRRATERVRI